MPTRLWLCHGGCSLALNPCKVIVAHSAHDYGLPRAVNRLSFHCDGLTIQQETARIMVRRGVLREAWWHLVNDHGLPVSERQYAANTRLWKAVDDAIHSMYDEGYTAGLRRKVTGDDEQPTHSEHLPNRSESVSDAGSPLAVFRFGKQG